MQLTGFVVQHPSVWLAAPIVGLSALSTTPPLVPLTILVAALHLHICTVLPRGKILSHGGAQVFLLSLAASIAHLGASLDALSTRGISVLALASLSALTSIVSLSTIVASYYFSRSVSTPWPKLTIFPALWATVWGTVAHLSPVGRLITWSPVVGLGPYQWVRPILGQWGVDWIVAAWAVVCAEFIGNWLVGPAGDDLDAASEQDQLVSVASEDAPNLTTPVRPTQETSAWSRARATSVLVALLIALSAPPLFVSSLPDPVLSEHTTPLSVGCILPFPHRSGERTGAPTLKDYISETTAIQARADILLWPESAVRFDTEEAKQEAFSRVRANVGGKKLIGVSFEEYVGPDRSKGEHGPGIRQNSFALLSRESEKPLLEYTKRMLVPSELYD